MYSFGVMILIAVLIFLHILSNIRIITKQAYILMPALSKKSIVEGKCYIIHWINSEKHLQRQKTFNFMSLNTFREGVLFALPDALRNIRKNEVI